jgi:hypothetical protein
VCFAVAKELDDSAHSVDATKLQTLSIEAKSVLGIFADLVQVKRAAMIAPPPKRTLHPRSPPAGMGGLC